MRNNKKDYLGTDFIVQSIADATGVPLKYVRQVWRAVPSVMTEALVKGIPIKIPSVCTITPYVRSTNDMTYCLDKERNGCLGIRKKASEGGHHLTLRLPPLLVTRYVESKNLKLALNPDTYYKNKDNQVRMKPEVLQGLIDEALRKKGEV